MLSPHSRISRLRRRAPSDCNIVFQHEGEGGYREIERMVARLLNVNS